MLNIVNISIIVIIFLLMERGINIQKVMCS